MTYDDFQRAMERINKSQDRFNESMNRARKSYKFHTQQLEAAAVNLRKAIVERNKAMKVLDVKMIELAQAQTRTQQRLNNLIEKRRGGQPEAPVD